MVESFLEETFQPQRCVVATGQKMMDVQPKVTGYVTSDGLDDSVGLNMEQFADAIRTLFNEFYQQTKSIN